ncbi:hypothetical protein BC830DRAFT_315712 [Chytriomyces sp. MP71]|nr:hypothetical protein BC830DRAFT_315712 [Chytriomyces sp. MP71]
MSRRDEPVKFAPYLLKVNHPCHICSAKTGLRVRCSKEGCGCWFHVSCAIKEGILKPNRKRSVRTNLKLLLCTDHYNAVHNISKNGGPNSASARDRPGSGNGSSLKRAVGGPGGIGGKGDLKDWEAAKERRLHNQTSGNPGAKRRVVDSDVSDSERPSISKKPKTSQAKVSAEVSDYDHDIDKEASMEEEDEEIEEGGAPKVEVERRQSGGNGSSGFGGGGLASTSHSISNSKLANELFGKDSLPTSTNVPKINASNLGGNRRVSEASPLGVNGRDKVRPGGLARPRDPSGSSAPIDNPAELLQRVIRAQDKQTADLKSLISNLQKPTPVQKLPAAPASAASALDSLLDKAHEATEMTALRKELEKANSKIALMETNAMTLRANLVIIFNQLKLSAVTPDETSVDDYVAVIRDLMTKN